MSSLIPTLRTTMDKTQMTNEQDEVNAENQRAANTKIKYFLEFPEALHRVDNQQSIKFNEQLMRKLVTEKKKKNDKFGYSRLMMDCFKYRIK